MHISSNTIQALIGVAIVAVIGTYAVIQHNRKVALLRDHGIETPGQIVEVVIRPEKSDDLRARDRKYVEKVCRSGDGQDLVFGNSFGHCEVQVSYEFAAKDGNRHRGNWHFIAKGGVTHQAGQPITVRYADVDPNVSSVVTR